MVPEQSKTQWSYHALTYLQESSKPVPEHQHILFALDSACPMVHSWCIDYDPLTFPWSLLMGAFLHLTNVHSQVPYDSATCHDLPWLSDWPNWGTESEEMTDTHLGGQYIVIETLTAATKKLRHWGHQHGHAHINNTCTQDLIHSHTYQIKIF